MKNEKCSKGMEAIFDSFFLIYGERIPGRGEDNYFCAFDESRTLVSVFDGCGGLGSKKYPAYQNQTGAYIASRLASGAVSDWFTQEVSVPGYELASSVDARLRQALAVGKRYEGQTLSLRGSMVRDFPTTMAMALVVSNGKLLRLHSLWAGDSRVYILDEDGLAQITRDDVHEQDAFLNLRSDDSLQNVICAEGNYVIHHEEMMLEKPCLVLTCTDGCFGYYSSPMEFEAKLLSAILEESSPEQFEASMDSEFREISGDDYAMMAVSLGFGEYATLKKTIKKRWDHLYEKFLIRIWENRRRGEETEEMEARYWQSYRQSYERFLRKG